MKDKLFLMKSALGLFQSKEAYRNYYNLRDYYDSDKSKEFLLWEDLVKEELASKRCINSEQKNKEYDDLYYHVTEKGINFLIKNKTIKTNLSAKKYMEKKEL